MNSFSRCRRRGGRLRSQPNVKLFKKVTNLALFGRKFSTDLTQLIGSKPDPTGDLNLIKLGQKFDSSHEKSTIGMGLNKSLLS